MKEYRVVTKKRAGPWKKSYLKAVIAYCRQYKMRVGPETPYEVERRKIKR